MRIFLIPRYQSCRQPKATPPDYTQEVIQVTSKIVKITNDGIVIFVLFYNLGYRIFTQKWSTGDSD
jgi:hypothetical protein